MSDNILEYLKTNQVEPFEFLKALKLDTRNISNKAKALGDNKYKEIKDYYKSLGNYVTDNIDKLDEMSFSDVKNKFCDYTSNSDIYLKKVVKTSA